MDIIKLVDKIRENKVLDDDELSFIDRVAFEYDSKSQFRLDITGKKNAEQVIDGMLKSGYHLAISIDKESIFRSEVSGHDEVGYIISYCNPEYDGKTIQIVDESY